MINLIPSICTEPSQQHAAGAGKANTACASATSMPLADLNFLRSLPPPPPPSTPPPPLPSSSSSSSSSSSPVIMKHSLASNASLESLDTQTTISSSSSSSCCYDSEDDSEDTARLEDDNDVENSQLLLQQEQQQQSLSNQQKKKKKKQLSWGTVQIREYSRTIGDHPDVSYGPPLSLDWQYNQHEDISLDSHEQSRIVDGNGKKKRFIRMSSLTRRNLLANEFLIPHADLRRAELVVEKVQRRRAQSNRQGTFSAKLEDGLQSFRRQLGRRFSVSREVVFAAMSASSGPFSSSFTGMNGMTMASMSM